MSAIDWQAMERILEQYYPRNERGELYLPYAPAPVLFAKISKAPRSTRTWVQPIEYQTVTAPQVPRSSSDEAPT